MTNKLLDKGFNVYKHQAGNRYYVFVGEFNNWNTANNTLNNVKEVVAEAYIKKINFQLKQTEHKANGNNTEKKTEEISTALNKANEEKKVVQNEEKTSKNKDLEYYRNQSDYVFKNGYLIKVNDNKYKFSFPNGKIKVYKPLNEYEREINENAGYLLVLKNEKLVDLLPQQSKNNFSKSLKDLGYINDISLSPDNSEFRFKLPTSKNIIKNELFLELFLEKAEFLNKNIYLDILINDNHLKTIELKGSQSAHEYIIDINNKNIEFTDVLNITIKASFSTDVLKKSLNKYYKNSWVKLNSKSKIHFSLKDQPTYSINNFLNMESEEIRLFHDKNLSRNLMEKYIKLSTNLNRKYKNKVSNMLLSSDKKAADLNNINNRIKNIVMSEEFKTTELLDNLTLKLAPKDAGFFLSEYSKLINSNKLNLNSYYSEENEDLILNSYRKNNKDNSKKGWGNIVYKYFIPGNIFKTDPKEIKLHLTGSYFIPFQNQAYLKVYLNGRLIKVEELKKSKYFENKIINIPGQEIESYNDLKIVFSQMPAKNLNKFSNKIETYINPESYITYSGDIVRKTNFKNLLSDLTGKGKILIVEKDKKELFKTAALFNKYVHENDYSNLDFKIDYLKNYDIDSEAEDLKWILAIGAEKIDEKVKSKVQFDGNNIEINNKQNEENISLNFDKPLSYIDVNTIDNKSIVFINTNGSYDNLQKMLIEINKKESIYDLEGNLLIFNGENYRTFNIENETSNNKSEIYLTQFRNLIKEYKVHAYIISVLLIILLLIWIYHKTSRNRNSKD